MQKLTNIEFCGTPEGGVLIRDAAGVRTYREEDKAITDVLFPIIEENYPEAFAALNEVYAKSRANVTFFKFRCVDRFIRCNFGTFDRVLDIDEFGRFNFEQVACPIIGECKYHGVICVPKFNTRLTMREREVMRLYCAGRKAEEIADILSLSPTTVETHKRNAMQRIKVNTLAEFIIWANEHSL